jgi:glycosyltransferase involved in cell wall biosynthesis
MITKEIFYWSPFTSRVATVNAVLNSALSLTKYSKGNYKISILNASGEWNIFSDSIKKKKIDLINLNKSKYLYNKNLDGFLQSRLAYVYVFLRSFISLKRLLKNTNPNFLIIHLITSLPLFLFTIFNFETKLILRISGFPKMNFIRKFFWKLALKNVYKITCPTEATKNDLIKLKICNSEKINVLYDPIIIFNKIIKKKSEKIEKKFEDNYFVAIGRLTKQKNFEFLINCFKKIVNKNKKLKLFIIGSGEKKRELQKIITNLELKNNVELLGYIENIFPILNKAKCFILSSLWEDPGFVIVEAATLNIPIISSNCKNGPFEILSGGDGGYLYRTNDEKDFLKKFDEFYNNTPELNFKKKIVAKKNIKKFTLFNHFLNFKKILN